MDPVPLLLEPDPSPRARWRRLLREPLLHFFLIGMALFVGYRVLNPSMEAGARSNVIELTNDDLIQMSVTWVAQGRPAPTPEQMISLVDSKVREEIFAREAVALGLDKDDTIIKRRLAQKMEFLAEDLSAVPEPTNAELEGWFRRTPSGLRFRRGSRFATSISRQIGAVRKHTRMPRTCWQSSHRHLLTRRPNWPIRSCSRIATATVRPSS